MSLILTELAELRVMGRQVMDGAYDKENIKLRLDIYNQTAKRLNMLIQITTKSENRGGKDKIWKRLDNMNIISSDAAIDIGSQLDEKIKCPEHGGCLIDRGQCLDYSGLERNLDKCQRCEQFSVTRKYMMP